MEFAHPLYIQCSLFKLAPRQMVSARKKTLTYPSLQWKKIRYEIMRVLNASSFQITGKKYHHKNNKRLMTLIYF